MEGREYGKAATVLKQFWSINRGSNHNEVKSNLHRNRKDAAKVDGRVYFLSETGMTGTQVIAHISCYIIYA
jgi:hypothetical protein